MSVAESTSRHSKSQNQSIQLLFDHFQFFFPPQRNSHQFLTHVNAPFQYFMFLYGVLTIEHGNGRHILLSYFSGSVSIFLTELCTPMQKEPICGEREREMKIQANSATANLLSIITFIFHPQQYFLYTLLFCCCGFSKPTYSTL